MAKKTQDDTRTKILYLDQIKEVDWGAVDKYDFSMTPDTVRKATMSSYLTHQYEAYRADNLKEHGKVVSQNNYATNVIGIDNVAFSVLKNGHKLPQVEQADILAAYYGPVVWDICGYSRRMPQDKMLYVIADIWPHLSDRARAELLERTRNLYDNGDIKNDNGKVLDKYEEQTKI